MPLKVGKENIGKNIKEEEKNHPKKQAVAIALNEAGKSKKKTMGGPNQSKKKK
jgi:hypothetical protein